MTDEELISWCKKNVDDLPHLGVFVTINGIENLRKLYELYPEGWIPDDREDNDSKWYYTLHEEKHNLKIVPCDEANLANKDDTNS